MIHYETTVITLHHALYNKTKELVWLQPEKLNNVVVRLSSFNIAMNFLSIIGSHFAQSGFVDIWWELECLVNVYQRRSCMGKNEIVVFVLTVEDICGE